MSLIDEIYFTIKRINTQNLISKSLTRKCSFLTSVQEITVDSSFNPIHLLHIKSREFISSFRLVYISPKNRSDIF